MTKKISILIFLSFIFFKGFSQKNDLIDVKNTLLEIRSTDQLMRDSVIFLENKFGSNSAIVKNYWHLIKDYDKTNLMKVEKILESYGWLGKSSIGREASQTIFLVIQHSSLNVQKKYLPLMRKAVFDKKAEPAELAMLEDRVLADSGFKQIYGTQVSQDSLTGKYYIIPLSDPDHIDHIRKKVGLPSISEYTKMWGFTWDIDVHRNDIIKYKKIYK